MVDTAERALAELPDVADRELASRIESRRLALNADLAQLRLRYEEVMRWANPPWDEISRRLDPRPEAATPDRLGATKIHVDLVGQAIDRWAALEVGAPVTIRVIPEYVPAPDPSETDPERIIDNRKQYEIDRAIAQTQASHMEMETRRWMVDNAAHRTLLWAAWAKNAFGKAILRTGWDPDAKLPTLELLENPSQVAYGWTKRYGNRRLGWVMMIDQMSAMEANRRFNLDIPTDEWGAPDYGRWTGIETSSDLDMRAEQQDSVSKFVWVEEYWELDLDAPAEERCLAALCVGGKVVEKARFPWKRLPFKVIEDAHVVTYLHGRSMGERLISINAAYDDMLTKQQEVIEFEAGPRYKGLNMANSGDEVEMPRAFHLLPLREGEDIQQIDTRVDFFPTQVHAEELREAKYHSTGLTPIAWGMSPNAQTSGRALSAEWRAVELPLHAKLINMTPEVREIALDWWDYAEAYHEEYRELADGWRNFEVIWEPLDIRDASERTLDVIQLVNANLMDPETAMERVGIENVSEVMAKIRQYLVDPVYNPLRYQQYLILQQLEIQIRMAALQLQQAEAAMGMAPAGPAGAPGAPGSVDETAQRGEVAAGQAAQGPAGPVDEGMNQPGMSPEMPGGLPVDTSVLSQTPMEGGVGNRVMFRGGGPMPTAGNVPQ